MMPQMPEVPLVSVIIPTRNRAGLLREAVASVLAVQRVGFALEVIVVDDGADAETREVAAAYPVQYVRTDGIGASAARNRGVEAAHGDYLAFLDDDDLWLPSNIRPQLKAFQEHPEYGAVYAQIQPTDANRRPSGDPIPRGPLTSGWIFDDLLAHWPQLGSVVVRTSVARQVGGFDTALISEEEWDWILRIAQRFPIGRIEEPVILYRQRGYGDDAAEVRWRRLPDTIKVFRRHTSKANLTHRIRFQRLLWAHRGWYAAAFVHSAQQHAYQGNRSHALRCLRYALYTSPLHAVAVLAASWRQGTQNI